MFRIEYGRSYIWLFAIFLIAFILGMLLCSAFGCDKFGIVTIPAFLAILLSSELRSGVALDSWWRATYLKGSWQYRALTAWHAVALAVFLGMSYVFIAV